MKLSNLKLGVQNIAPMTSKKTLPVNRVGVIKKRNADGGTSDEPQEFYIECGTRMSDTIKVKLPLSAESKIKDLETQLTNDLQIEVSFEKLKLTAYALKAGDGSILSGVAARATDFTIESSVSDSFDDILIED